MKLPPFIQHLASEEEFSPRLRYSWWFVLVFLILARAPNLVLRPRLWAEEASLYLAYSRDHGFLEGILLIPTTTGAAGYLNLAASLPATLAAYFLPLELAPWVTTLTALALQSAPLFLVIFGKSFFWKTPWERLITCLLIVIAPSVHGEVWLNTINCQIYCGLLAVILLGEDPEYGGQKWRWGWRCALLLCALSGPYTVFLAPVFLLRHLLCRHGQTRFQALWVGVAAGLQGTSFLWVSRNFSLLQNHFELGPWGARLASILEHQVFQAILGEAGARALVQSLVPTSPWLLGPVCLLFLLLLLGTLRWPSSERRRWLLPLAFLCLITAISVSTGPALSRGRYAVLPSLVFLAMLVGAAARAPTPRQWLARGLMALAILTGFSQYWQEHPLGSLGKEPGSPSWSEEVSRWRADPQRPLAIWPYTEPAWHTYLTAAGSTPRLQAESLQPFQLASVGEKEGRRFRVDRLTPTFKTLLEFRSSQDHEQAEIKLALQDSLGATLAETSLGPFQQDSLRLFFLEARHFQLAPGRSFEEVRSIELSLRARRLKPVQIRVERLDVDFRVNGLLETWLPSGALALDLVFLLLVAATGWLGVRVWKRLMEGAGGDSRGERVLRLLLLALVGIPAITFFFGRHRDQVAFVLYREPKLVAITILGALFLGFQAWILRPTRREILEVLHHRVFLALAAFLSFMALSHRWVLVGENFLYEGEQYFLLSALLVVLTIWARRQRKVREWVRACLLGSLAVVSLVSVVQLIMPLPFLLPITPEIGVRHPSLMGYKNPMALALLGQIFLLAERALRTPQRRLRLAWRLLLAIEILLIASLESRTSYLALAIGALSLGAIYYRRSQNLKGQGERGQGTDSESSDSERTVSHSKRSHSPGSLRPLATAALGLISLVAVAWLASPQARQRAESLVGFLASPQQYLESDRGTYLRNTLHMVHLRPLGVGLGDWQSWYPVYRRHNRDVAFTSTHQVRRAHSDHVQFLGEGGWLGACLWLLFLILLLDFALRNREAESEFEGRFLTAQLIAVIVAMGSDYFLELPYQKFQFFLLIFLVLTLPKGNSPPKGNAPASLPNGFRGTGRVRKVAIALAVTGFAAFLCLRGLGLGFKIYQEARMGITYRNAIAMLQRTEQVPREQLEIMVQQQELFDSLPGHTKTMFRHYLRLAQSAKLIGRQDLAKNLARRALELAPFSPDAYALMARMESDPTLSRQWEEAGRFIFDEATDGSLQDLPQNHPKKKDLSE